MRSQFWLVQLLMLCMLLGLSKVHMGSHFWLAQLLRCMRKEAELRSMHDVLVELA